MAHKLVLSFCTALECTGRIFLSDWQETLVIRIWESRGECRFGIDGYEGFMNSKRKQIKNSATDGATHRWFDEKGAYVGDIRFIF